MLEGRRIVVTGAARGLGRAIAWHLGELGAAILAIDIDEGGLAQTRSGGSRKVFTTICDVASEEQTATLAGQTVSVLGGVDGVVNNAALVAVTRAPASQISVAEFDRVMAVNLRGPWLMYRALAPLLAASGGGSIVNLSSETALTGSRHLSHYVASKAGVIGLTRALSREAGPDGIRVNAVAPGFTDTEGARAIGDPDSYDTSGTPLGRVATPADIVGAVAFLLGDSAAFMTGQTLVVNGGRTAGAG